VINYVHRKDEAIVMAMEEGEPCGMWVRWCASDASRWMMFLSPGTWIPEGCGLGGWGDFDFGGKQTNYRIACRIWDALSLCGNT